ncbi:hypothetical protein P3X46_025765 [Hevea brasiliensis]|uniref:Uncharacterized protein n=1 Tax=Hevea brasiliensis TaxID=3981 RepID=A0ABQ9L6S5_HEVBR|nr:hypothetical protein P3X46_025765 [Hevea brasiliensis]
MCQRSSVRASSLESNQFMFSLGMIGSSVHLKGSGRGLCLSVTDSDRLATDTSGKGPCSTESSISNNQLSSADSPGGTSQFQTSVDNDPEPQTSGVSNVSTVSSDLKLARQPNLQSTPKRSLLTVKEILRAARVISRYAESKAQNKKRAAKYWML